jgi:hypothetical protein
LSRRTRAWNTHANRSHHRIDWRFTTVDARRLQTTRYAWIEALVKTIGFPSLGDDEV